MLPRNTSRMTKYLSVCAVAIPDQVARDLLPAASLSELIGDPFGRWMCSNSEPQKLPPAMTHDQQAIEQPERDCRHHEQAHRGNAVDMIAEEFRRHSPHDPFRVPPIPLP